MAFQIRKPKDRSLEVELNLAPFLDIMSVCICFLLTTAVWVSVSGLPVSQSSAKGAGVGKGCEMRARYTSPTSMRLTWKEQQKFTVTGASHPAMLAELHKTLSRLSPKESAGQCALIATLPSVKYGELISAADIFRQNHFQRIGLAKGGPR